MEHQKIHDRGVCASARRERAQLVKERKKKNQATSSSHPPTPSEQYSSSPPQEMPQQPYPAYDQQIQLYSQQYAPTPQQYPPNPPQYTPTPQQYPPNTQQYTPTSEQYIPTTQQQHPSPQQYTPSPQQHGPTPRADIPNPVRERRTRRSRARQPNRGLAGCAWYTSTPMPGGPQNPEILIGFQTHVAYALWEDADYMERKPLVMQTRDKAQRRWQLPRHEPWAQMVVASGISDVPHILFQTPNASLITAFIERWHPETNTFHMPFGEMTITLHDVHAILGIPIVGLPVRSSGYFLDPALLPYVEYKRTNQSAVLLRSIPSVCNNQAQGNQESMARGFLWHLLGSSLFPDKSGTHVPLEYFNLLGDINSVGQYAWGAGTLASLYDQLGKASRRESKHMA